MMEITLQMMGVMLNVKSKLDINAVVVHLPLKMCVLKYAEILSTYKHCLARISIRLMAMVAVLTAQ
jgi:hypothetical protein